MGLPDEASLASGPFMAVAGRVNVVAHTWPVEIASHSVLLATFAEVVCQIRIIWRIEEAWLKGDGYRCLYNDVE